MIRRVFAPFSLAALTLSGCHLVRGRDTTPSAAAPTPQPSNPSSSSPGDAEALDAEVRALVTETLTPQLCPRLLGAWVGLPGESNLRGRAAGTATSVGRWWIRRCSAQLSGDRIALSMGGSGWTWVDREAGSFRVRQYLLFDMQAAFSADVRVAYDRTRRVATLWMRPQNGVEAEVTPRGMVSPEPTGLFGRLLSGVAAATGTSVSERARAQAAEMGSTQLRERLGAGLTMTYDLPHWQVDFMVGALDRGELPERPWPATESGPWLLNQRATVWPGGLDVSGPIDGAAHGALSLDVALEEGEGAVLTAVCADDLARYFDARLRDPGASVEAPRGVALTTLSAGRASDRVRLPASVAGAQNDHPCPLAITLATPPSSQLPARVRARVAPADEAAATAPARRRVQVTLVEVTVAPQNPSGQNWDVIGGEADLVVTTAAVGLGREVDTSPVVPNQNRASLNRRLAGAFEVARDLPLRFTVSDDDTTTRERIGHADLDAATLPTADGEVSLPIRAPGTVGTQLGTLRLRVEWLP